MFVEFVAGETSRHVQTSFFARSWETSLVDFLGWAESVNCWIFGPTVGLDFPTIKKTPVALVPFNELTSHRRHSFSQLLDAFNSSLNRSNRSSHLPVAGDFIRAAWYVLDICCESKRKCGYGNLLCSEMCVGIHAVHSMRDAFGWIFGLRHSRILDTDARLTARLDAGGACFLWIYF